MTDEFEPTWQALYENGSSSRNKDATKRFWDSLSSDQQHLAFTNITRKAQEGRFIQYDPIRAIKENIRTYHQDEPVNYNGKHNIDALMRTTPMVIARYKGSFGTYTLDDALSFGMEIKEGLNFKYVPPIF